MRSNQSKVLLFTLALGTVTVCALADDKAARKEIQAFFDQAMKLTEKKDVEGMVKLTSPGATFVLPGGVQLSVKEWAETTKKAMGEIEKIKSVILLDKVTVKGKEAVVTITETDDFGITKDRGHKYREVSKETITLTKSPKGWLASKFVVASDTLTKDGKPFTPQAPR